MKKVHKYGLNVGRHWVIENRAKDMHHAREGIEDEIYNEHSAVDKVVALFKNSKQQKDISQLREKQHSIAQKLEEL